MKPVSFFFFSFFFLFSLTVKAQEVISADGGYFHNGGKSVSYTIGEPVNETLAGASGILTQGFQQSRLEYYSIEESNDMDFQVDIFPNPVKEILNVQINEERKSIYTYHLYSSGGKLLREGTINNRQVKIHLTRFDPGAYILKISSGHKYINFVVIKH